MAQRGEEADILDVIVLGSGDDAAFAAGAARRAGLATALVEPPGPSARLVSAAFAATAEVVRSARGADAYGVLAGPVTIAFDQVQRRARELCSERLDADGRARGLALGDGGVHVTLDSGVDIVARNLLALYGRTKADDVGIDHERVLGVADLLELDALPERLVVLSGSVLGCELASAFAGLGSTVELVEPSPHLLPEADRDVSSLLARLFGRRGIEVRLDTAKADAVDGVTPRPGATSERTVVVAEDDGYETSRLLSGLGVRMTSSGRPLLDGGHRTNVAHVYVADGGDGGAANGGLPSKIASIVGELGGRGGDAELHATCVFSYPEIAWVGLSEDGARQVAHEVTVVRDGFAGNGRAMIVGETEGFVKVVAERQPDGTAGSLLGVHVIGPRASELVGQHGLACRWGASPAELAGLVQPHPTLSEVYGEALFVLEGRGLHLGA